MFSYEKRLQYPVKIKTPNAKYASIIVSQLGGPDGEVGASLRYLTQRMVMPYDKIVGILTDVGVEELAHVEMVSSILFTVAVETLHILATDVIERASCKASAIKAVIREVR